MTKIQKFDKISNFEGTWGTPKHEKFSERFVEAIFSRNDTT